MRFGLRRCSSEPVRVRMNRLPRFSRVHISLTREREREREREGKNERMST